MSRSTKDVFEDHLALRMHGDVEGDILRNYADDIVILSGDGEFRRHDGVRTSAKMLDKRLPKARLTYRSKLVDGDVAFLEWSAESPSGRVDDGTDTFVIRDGKIAVQTIHYTVRPLDPR
jgi:hypothetical protein